MERELLPPSIKPSEYRCFCLSTLQEEILLSAHIVAVTYCASSSLLPSEGNDNSYVFGLPAPHWRSQLQAASVTNLISLYDLACLTNLISFYDLRLWVHLNSLGERPTYTGERVCLRNCGDLGDSVGC